VPVLRQELEFQGHMSLSLFVFNDLRWEVVVRFVDIGGIVDQRFVDIDGIVDQLFVDIDEIVDQCFVDIDGNVNHYYSNFLSYILYKSYVYHAI